MSDQPFPPSLANLSLVETVLRVRDTVGVFERRVGGSSEFIEDLLDDGLKRPYCWVVPMAEYGDEINQDEGTQVRHVVLGFMVCVDNTMQKGSALGKSAPKVHDGVMPLQDAIEQTLLTWEPASIKLDGPIEYRERIFLGMDNTEAHYQINFELSYVRFSPYYLPKQIREILQAEADGSIVGAKQLKQIAARYNVEENVVRTSLETGYFSMPNTATAPPPEEVAQAWEDANVLDVEGKTEVVDIEQVETGKLPDFGFTGHKQETTIHKKKK